MFSDFLKNSKLDFNKIKDLIERNFDEEKFLNVLLKSERERLSFDDLIILLNNKKLKFLDKVMSCASKISFQRHGKVIKFYAPLYVSNECVNKCK
jgi:2-iminoacetate synthase